MEFFLKILIFCEAFFYVKLAQSPIADSFIVNANYGVQESNILNSTNSWARSATNLATDDDSNIIYGHSAIKRTDDSDKPSVNELQTIVSNLIKGATKVHQVVKVPAIYEIHLQEAEKDSKMPYRKPEFHRKRNSFRGNRFGTATWNLPSKINYFTTQKPVYYGKYWQPQPFTKPYHGVPDLSLYYAKKKELENERRRGFRAQTIQRRAGKAIFPIFDHLKYVVIHVREKA